MIIDEAWAAFISDGFYMEYADMKALGGAAFHLPPVQA